jgi:large subunit ribosomal protein L6
VTVVVEPEVVHVTGPRGALSERKNRDIGVEEQDGVLDRHAPDRPRRAPAPARPRALARGQHGRGRHAGLREAPGAAGRRLPRHAQGPRPRARARLLAPGEHRGARGHRVRGAPADPRVVKGNNKQVVGEIAPTSASSVRRSPTRARASATRASTSPGRSASAHEHRHEGSAPPQASPPRPREGPRHRDASAHLGLPLQPRHPGPARRRRGRPHARGRVLDRAELRGLKPMEQAAGPASCWPSARSPPGWRRPSSTVAATSTTAV